jgi:hypothetical protein
MNSNPKSSESVRIAPSSVYDSWGTIPSFVPKPSPHFSDFLGCVGPLCQKARII